MEYSEGKTLFNAVFIKCEFVGKTPKIKVHFKDVCKKDHDEFVCDALVITNLSNNDNISEQIVPFSTGQYVSFNADNDFKNIKFTDKTIVGNYGKYE